MRLFAFSPSGLRLNRFESTPFCRLAKLVGSHIQLCGHIIEGTVLGANAAGIGSAGVVNMIDLPLSIMPQSNTIWILHRHFTGR